MWFTAHAATSTRTLCKVVDRQLAVRILGKILKRDLRLAFSDHKVDDDKTLEDDSPCRVAQAVGESAEDFGDTCFASMCRNENMLDILGLWCCELYRGLVLAHGMQR